PAQGPPELPENLGLDQRAENAPGASQEQMAMKLFTGWLLAAGFTVGGLALGATAAEAQVVGPSRVSDFGGPYVEAPYRGGPYYAPPPAEVGPPPPRYGYGGYGPGYAPGYAPAALVPPYEVYNIIREAG